MPRHSGPPLGSRELLRLYGRISRPPKRACQLVIRVQLRVESQGESASYHGTRRGNPRAQVGEHYFFIARRAFFKGSNSAPWQVGATSLRPANVHCLLGSAPVQTTTVLITATHLSHLHPWTWPYRDSRGQLHGFSRHKELVLLVTM